MSFESLSLFDYFIFIIISISIIFSFIKGFVQSLLGLLTWIGATIITLIFYENLSNFISFKLGLFTNPAIIICSISLLLSK